MLEQQCAELSETVKQERLQQHRDYMLLALDSVRDASSKTCQDCKELQQCMGTAGNLRLDIAAKRQMM